MVFEAEYIDLNDGFDTETGAFFEAKIDPCALNILEEATPRNISSDTITKKEIPCNSIMNIYPNPFQSQTNIEVYLNEDSPIALKLFTLTGQEVTTILNKNLRPQGYHNISLTKLSIPNGIYILSLATKNCNVTKQIIIQ